MKTLLNWLTDQLQILGILWNQSTYPALALSQGSILQYTNFKAQESRAESYHGSSTPPPQKPPQEKPDRDDEPIDPRVSKVIEMVGAIAMKAHKSSFNGFGSIRMSCFAKNNSMFFSSDKIDNKRLYFEGDCKTFFLFETGSNLDKYPAPIAFYVAEDIHPDTRVDDRLEVWVHSTYSYYGVGHLSEDDAKNHPLVLSWNSFLDSEKNFFARYKKTGKGKLETLREGNCDPAVVTLRDGLSFFKRWTEWVFKYGNPVIME